MSEWISVKDRMPEKLPVLLYQPAYNLGGCDMPASIQIGYAFSSYTHWMPLPDPPTSPSTPNPSST